MVQCSIQDHVSLDFFSLEQMFLSLPVSFVTPRTGLLRLLGSALAALACLCFLLCSPRSGAPLGLCTCWWPGLEYFLLPASLLTLILPYNVSSDVTFSGKLSLTCFIRRPNSPTTDTHCFIVFCFIALHKCCTIYKLKMWLFISENITTHFIAMLAYCGGLRPNLKYLQCMPLQEFLAELCLSFMAAMTGAGPIISVMTGQCLFPAPNCNFMPAGRLFGFLYHSPFYTAFAKVFFLSWTTGDI